MKTLPLDELNNLESALKEGALTREEIEDAVLDVMLIGWANGLDYASSILGETRVNAVDLRDALDHKIDNKTYLDRLREHIDNNDIDGIVKVADTESHRLYNEAVFETAEKSGKTVYKTWNTMLDDRVREAHEWLQGVTVPLHEKFYTEGDSALYPGDFGRADLNVGCRCVLEIKETP
jgi:hypothetical protein